MKDLSLHILDIVQNAIVAGADLIEVTVRGNTDANSLVITIKDNGCGMPDEVLRKVADPYYTTRTTRKVGMGIPLFMHSARQAGGDLQIGSEPGEGTVVTANFAYDHIDRPVLGDMAGIMSMLAGTNPDLDFIYHHEINERSYIFDTREVKTALDGMPINELPVIKYLKQMIRENLNEIDVESKKSL